MLPPLPSPPKFPFSKNPGIKGSKMEKCEQGRDEKIYRSVASLQGVVQKTCGGPKKDQIYPLHFGKVMDEVRYGLFDEVPALCK
ncbi:hypothetical protein TNCV_3182121 [Trichonephila clavipes]|nr:hypothetical protein TNCV_3182121 [Trichonephila clavipes]